MSSATDETGNRWRGALNTFDMGCGWVWCGGRRSRQVEGSVGFLRDGAWQRRTNEAGEQCGTDSGKR